VPRTLPGSVRVGVIFGGRSGEHKISCVSARTVVDGLSSRGHSVELVGVSTSGGWHRIDLASFRTTRWTTVNELVERRTQVSCGLAELLVCLQPPTVDVAFPVLHGTGGEDGTIQGVLTLAGVPFVGSGLLASAVCMDKDVAKRLLRGADLPVCDHEIIYQHADVDRLRRCGVVLPLFVKPARGGSSLGVSKVTEWSQLTTAVKKAQLFDPKVLVEQAITGRELSCGVLQDTSGTTICSPAAETIPGDVGWLDYDTKYRDPACRIDTSPVLEADVKRRIRDLALAVFDTLECAELLRVDCFLDQRDALYVNEVNTLPGMAYSSIFPEVWRSDGIDYADLVERLVVNARSSDDKR